MIYLSINASEPKFSKRDKVPNVPTALDEVMVFTERSELFGLEGSVRIVEDGQEVLNVSVFEGMVHLDEASGELSSSLRDRLQEV
jgi:hypothetical protein